MSKFDVTDRERNQVDLSATVTPLEVLNITGSYRYRDDNYESGVEPVQPLLAPGNGVTAAEISPRHLATLGLLETETNRYALDTSYAPTDRLTMGAFGSRERIESTQRRLEFNENDKLNPISSGLNTTCELGTWTRKESQWMAETEDKTNTIGLSAAYKTIPKKLRLATDYTHSLGKVDIEYSGFGYILETSRSQLRHLVWRCMHSSAGGKPGLFVTSGGG